MVNREIKFALKGRTFTAKFPNVGQIIDMESLKQALTNGRYGEMAKSGVASMFYALDLVDAIAFIQVCVPAASAYFDVRNYSELNIDESNDILEAYTKTIRPWYTEVFNELRKVSPMDGTEENSADKG